MIGPARAPADKAASAILLLLVFLLASVVTAEESPSARWEERIAAFEASDREQAPPRDGIVFVGSSSIRGWDLPQSFPDLPVINRGFGGSEIADSIHFADRIVIPHRPRVVVLYAGDNDMARGKTARRVAADFGRFVHLVHAQLPETRIIFISIKPSISRWNLVGEMREANRRIQRLIQQDRRLSYVDIDKPMIGMDGTPRRDLFRDDGLHLNARGYQLWAELVRPHLAAQAK